MVTEKIQIEQFIEQVMIHPRVLTVTENWRIEPTRLQKILSAYFRELGIYFVEVGHTQIILDTIVHHLKFSPEIHAIIRGLESEESKRKQSRHAS